MPETITKQALSISQLPGDEEDGFNATLPPAYDLSRGVGFH